MCGHAEVIARQTEDLERCAYLGAKTTHLPQSLRNRFVERNQEALLLTVSIKDYNLPGGFPSNFIYRRRSVVPYIFTSCWPSPVLSSASYPPISHR